MSFKNYLFAALTALTITACDDAAQDKVNTAKVQPNESTPVAAPATLYDADVPPLNIYMSEPAIMVFTKTRDWRHEEGIAGANKALIEIARDKAYGVFTTENGAAFNSAHLAKFKVVVFNNMTGDSLSPEQEDAFQSWLEAGGGLIALHGSIDSSHQDWEWYSKKIIGPTFISHPMAPQYQTARIDVLTKDHPVMAGVPESWEHSEEWYTFDSVPQDHGMTPIAGIDEATYSPRNTVYGVEDLRMDKDGRGAIAHPVIWSHCPGNGQARGRAVMSALGHLDDVYMNGNPRRILENAIDWVTVKTDLEGTFCN